MPKIFSKLPDVGTTIFSVISKKARDHGAVNISQGFPDFDCDPKLSQMALQAMNAGHNQYAPMPGVPLLKQEISKVLESRFSIMAEPDREITITSGATQGIYSTLATVIHPGDEVIVFEPVYDSYCPAIEAQGGKPVRIRLTGPDYLIDWTNVETKISPRCKMIIINNPHNPTGKVWRSEDLNQLAILANRYNLLILSDEVYTNLVFDGRRHLSVFSIPALRDRSFVAFSFGKTFHITGWKIGYLLASPNLTEEFRKVHQFTVFTVPTPLQYAIGEYLQQYEDWDGLTKLFQDKRNLLMQYLESSRFKVLPSEGTYFLCVDYSTISSMNDIEFVDHLIFQYGIATIPMSAFYLDSPPRKIIRLCFAKKDETIRAAGTILQNI